MKNEPKILFFDIETSFSVMASFSLWPNHISHNNILNEWHIICAAWKWGHQKRVYLKKTYDEDDSEIVTALRDAIIEADEIVYHNGDKFDFKKLQTRALINDIGPIPKPRVTDTLKQARKHFGFTSNRLDYIGDYLGLGGKMHTSSGLWLDALKKKKKAIDEMGVYNKRDVLLLEEVYNKLAPYIDVGYNKNLNKEFGIDCPKCGSNNLQSRGVRTTKAGKYKRFQCQDCGSWFQDGTLMKRNIPVRR